MAGRDSTRIDCFAQKRAKHLALLGSAALGVMALATLGGLESANADIGLAKGGKGTAYVTIMGGYQHRDGGAAVAPAAPVLEDPLPGFDVDALAIVNPDEVSASALIERGGASAFGMGKASRDSAESETEAEQSGGGNTAKATAKTSADFNSSQGGGNTEMAIGDTQTQGQANAAANRGASVDSNVVSSAQDPDDVASGSAGSRSAAGDPSTGSAGGSVFTGGFILGFNSTASPGNPLAVGGSISDSNGDASAGSQASANATNIGGNSAFNQMQAIATVTGGGTVGNSNNTATDDFAQVNFGVSSSIGGDLARAAGSPIGRDGLASAGSQSTTGIGGQMAASIAGGTTGTEMSTASVRSQLTPGRALNARATYERQTSAPTIVFDTVDDPIMTDLMNQNLEAEDGAFGGGTLGYVFMNPMLGLVDRVEAYMTRARNEDDDRQRTLIFEGASEDGQALVAAIKTAGYDIETREVLTQTELGMRFKSDRFAQGPIPLIFSLEPFYMRYEQEARYGVQYLAEFDGTVDADLWGGQLALESEIPLFGEALSWVGRVSAGLYHMDADARFVTTLNDSISEPGRNEDGYRLGGETGLRMALTPNASLTATGAVDHLSEAPFVAFRDGIEGAPSYVGTDELTQYRANLRLTLTTQLHRAQPVAYK